MVQARNWYEAGIKNDFEEMEHEFAFGIFRTEKQDYLFRCSVAPGTLLLERPNESCSIDFPTGNFLWIVNNRGFADTLVYFLQNGKGLDEKPTRAVDRPSVSFWSPRCFRALIKL